MFHYIKNNNTDTITKNNKYNIIVPDTICGYPVKNIIIELPQTITITKYVGDNPNVEIRTSPHTQTYTWR